MIPPAATDRAEASSPSPSPFLSLARIILLYVIDEIRDWVPVSPVLSREIPGSSFPEAPGRECRRRLLRRRNGSGSASVSAMTHSEPGRPRRRPMSPQSGRRPGPGHLDGAPGREGVRGRPASVRGCFPWGPGDVPTDAGARCPAGRSTVHRGAPALPRRPQANGPAALRGPAVGSRGKDAHGDLFGAGTALSAAPGAGHGRSPPAWNGRGSPRSGFSPALRLRRPHLSHS